MAHDIFISHSSKDKKAANAICHALEHNGIKCWIAPRDVTPGKNFGGEIIGAIKNCTILLLVFSKEANKSAAVAKEVERAVLGYNKQIIPYRIEDAAMSENLEFFLNDVHWLDAFPNDKMFDTLVKVIKNALGKNDGAADDKKTPLQAVKKLTTKHIVAAVLATMLIVGAIWGGVALWGGNSNNPEGSNPAVLDVYTFAEPLIERAVRHKLGIQDDDPVTYGDLLIMTDINISGMNPLMPGEFVNDPPDGNIHSLEDLVHMKSLRTLFLHRQPLSDISQLSENIMLREIEIMECPISDLSPLLSFPNLWSLYIQGTLVTDYSVIEELTSLRRLRINHERGVSRVSDLGDISLVTDLMLSAMELISLEGIEHLTFLEYLFIASTFVTDFSLLNNSSALPNLKELHICPCMQQYLHTLSRNDVEVVITDFCVIC